MKKLSLLLFLIFSFTTQAMWRDVKFNYKISGEKVVLNENKKSNTLLDELIKMDGQNIENLVDKNNIIKIVKISYQAPFKLPKAQANGRRKAAKMIEVKQQGLLASFANNIREALIKKDSKLKMQYKNKDPFSVRFILNNAVIAAPALVTDNDNKWKVR